MIVAEVTLQLDDVLIERLRELAQLRGCSMESLIARSLREQLSAEADKPDENAVADWNKEEAAFLHETVRALDQVPAGTPLVPGDATEWDEPGT